MGSIWDPYGIAMGWLYKILERGGDGARHPVPRPTAWRRAGLGTREDLGELQEHADRGGEEAVTPHILYFAYKSILGPGQINYIMKFACG